MYVSESPGCGGTKLASQVRVDTATEEQLIQTSETEQMNNHVTHQTPHAQQSRPITELNISVLRQVMQETRGQKLISANKSITATNASFWFWRS